MSGQLSVILPMWNAGEWAGNIMSQLAEQLKDYPETELIAVDDGSDTPVPVDGWKIIRQKHGGVARARNTGLKKATGDYIAFVDADDDVLPNYLHTIYQAMRAGDCDYAAFSWWSGKNECLIDTRRKLPNFAVWGYCFTRKMIEGEMFDENLNAGEDYEWLDRVIKPESVRKVVPIAIYRYNWDRNPDSLSKRFNRGELPRERSK